MDNGENIYRRLNEFNSKRIGFHFISFLLARSDHVQIHEHASIDNDSHTEREFKFTVMTNSMFDVLIVIFLSLV